MIDKKMDDVNNVDAEKEVQDSQQIDKEEPQKSEIELLKEENESLKDSVLRQMAEFDNFRKRTQKEKSEIYSEAKADCAKGFIAILDNLERALESASEQSDFKNGIEMIVNQFNETLNNLGVEEIPSLNQPFNPEYHDAVNQIQDDKFEKNTICQVFQKGYKAGDKVIRHAMVVVANP